MNEQKILLVNRSELAVMLGISNSTAATYLNPATQKEKLPKRFGELITFVGSIPYMEKGQTNAGDPIYAYPVLKYFPLCRWPDVKKLAGTRPDVVEEYFNWVYDEARELPLLWGEE